MLVEDVLEFSRGGEDVAREPLSVASLLDEAAAVLAEIQELGRVVIA